MKQKSLLFTICIILSHVMQLRASGRDDLAIKLIPDSLLQGANTIVRLSETSIKITNPAQAIYEIHDIVTILNESGASELSQSYSYNQFCKIKDFHVSIYDKDGKQMNKHGLDDMKDVSLYDGFSLFNDARLKHIQTNGGKYPITIDRRVVMDYNGLIDFPDWYIQKADQSVESSQFTIQVPAAIDIHFKNYNTSLSPAIKSDKTKVYTWTAKGLKPLKAPAESYGELFYYPHIDISPSKFEIGGHKGSMDSWSQFGTALAKMWKDKRILSEGVAKEIKNMVKDVHSDKEKIEILYTYLQKNFHYVSIQIGIGGWIPFDAATVHEVKYGDCKALSNYMCAILEVAGVRSHPVVIQAGRDVHAMDTSFPSSHFNHAILCAEADGKPLWLECTNSALPPGELGAFTEGRYGLMIGDSTGMILATPPSDPELNTLIITHDVSLSAGRSSITCSLSLSGEYRMNAKTSLSQGTDKEQATYVFTSLHVKQPETFKLSAIKDSASAISVTISGNTENIFDFKTGSRSFLPSSFLGSWYKNIAADNDRKDDLLIDFPFCKKEKLQYHIDNTYSVSLPADFDIDNPMVYFHRKVEKGADNNITLTTQLKIKKHIIHPGEIALFKESLQKVNKCLQQKVVLEAK